MNLPAVPLRGMTIVPGMTVHFDITRSRSIRTVERAMEDGAEILAVTQKDPQVAEPKREDLYPVGTVCTVRQLMKLPDKNVRVLVEGRERAAVSDFSETDSGYCGEAEECPWPPFSWDEEHQEAMLRAMQEAAERYRDQNPAFSEGKKLEGCRTLGEAMTLLLARFAMPWEVRQELLMKPAREEVCEFLYELMRREAEVLRLKKELQARVREGIEKNQKEFLIREQIRVLRQELGEDESTEADLLREQAEKLTAPEEVKEVLQKELRRLRNMPAGSQEATVCRTYIETLMDIPWMNVSRDNADILLAQKILDEDHYGLEKIKERILEYLAVRTFSGKGDGSILCLVGPPGTGKTSIARSIARALDKKYVRVCLGGVRDEAEIRGHRRTYVGAMPGRIVSGLRQAKTANPLMLLDEIDKVSSDYKGDTSSALLEVLDAEQNVCFRDHYVELPLDLSRVMFIATANTTETIPEPLLDRMEIIQLTGYTENEKFHIGKEYLYPKELKKNGLTEEQLPLTDEVFRKIIHHYTREAGVRQLERMIGSLCRKAARKMLEEGVRSVPVTEQGLEGLLGKEKYNFDSVAGEAQTGIVRGLAWTKFGGDTLEVEVSVLPGEGGLKLTGKLGDVMKESAEAALTWVRSVSGEYGVDEDFFASHQLHVHIPEGAVPKDGPSAGITLGTALLSAAAGRPVRADVAMTGEITLRGRVLPVGGLKEKLLAASMAGVKTVLVPVRNRPDIEELSDEITGDLRIVYVSQMADVIRESFV